MNIALVTDAVRPHLTHDDAPLPAAFARLGHRAVPADWADPGVDWASFDAIVIRSPWNYHERWPEFDAWLASVAHLRLFNPAQILRWNLTKSYLAEMADAGLPVIPTLRLPPDRDPDLTDAIARWGEIVVKPEIGAGGALTFRATAATRAGVQDAIRPRMADGVGFLVQPFLPAIFAGEWSLVYLDGRYSHAVRKTGAAGQFLIHEEHGGRVDPAIASPELIAIADRIAAYVPDLPYARVDLLGDGADALLVELELVEPELFLRYSGGGAERLANAIIRRVRQPVSPA